MKKEQLYKTAKALVSCAGVEKGEFVKIQYLSTCACHRANWYLITETEKKVLGLHEQVAYPAHHLTDFCL